MLQKNKKLKSVSGLSINNFGISTGIIFLCCFFMTTETCFSQFIPRAKDRVLISLIDDSKPLLMETASDTAQLVAELNNGATLLILENTGNWLKIKLKSGETGWLNIEPEICNFMLLNIGLPRQKKPLSKKKDENENEYWVINVSTQYRELPDAVNIRYYGLEPEYFIGDNFSISGHLYAGKGSDNHSYFHIPVFGFLVSSTLGFILNEVFDGEFYSKELYKFLLIETFYYHNRLNKFFDISASLSLLGLDISEVYGRNNEIAGLITNGMGLNFRFLPVKNIVLSSSISLKHFIDLNNSFSTKNQFGYTVGFKLGVVL